MGRTTGGEERKGLHELLSRLGGMIVEPRRTLEGIARGGRGGLFDLLLLLLVEVVAVRGRELVRQGWTLVADSYSAGLSGLLNTISDTVLLPLVAVFGGTLVTGLVARRGPASGRRLDLVALCVVPPVSLDLAATLAAALANVQPPGWVVLGAGLVGLAWLAALLRLAVRVMRDAASALPGSAESPSVPSSAAPPPTTSTPARRSFRAGLGLALLLGALLAATATWTVSDWDKLRPLSVGQPAPAFELRTADGRRVSLAALRGRVVLVDFWASWCGPCVRELPELGRLGRELGPRGLAVLAVNVEENAAAARSAPDGLTVLVEGREVAARYGVDQLPHRVLVGRDGVIRYARRGAGGARALAQHLEQALGPVAPTGAAPTPPGRSPPSR